VRLSLTNLLWAAAIVLRFASAETAGASFIVLALIALQGRSTTIQALAASWLFSMLNPAIAPEPLFAALGRYGVIAAAAFSAASRGRGMLNHPSGLGTATLGLAAAIALHSLLVSPVPDVSLMKLLAWLVVVLTLLSIWGTLNARQRSRLFHFFTYSLLVLLLLSLPFVFVPSVGYQRNGFGFQGVLTHPQVFGPTAAVAAALVGGRIFADAKPRWKDMLWLALCGISVVLSASRTAAIAMVAGLLICALLSPKLAGVGRRRLLPGLYSRRSKLVLTFTIPVILFSAPLLGEYVWQYMQKGSEAATLADAARASRGRLVEDMIDNIKIHPWSGIGFGIASDAESMVIERDGLLGLPLSAPLEKGVLPIAILEELGLIVGCLTYAWFYFALRRASRSGPAAFAVVATLLLVNLGEYVFFSVGGMGMLQLVLFAGAVTAPEVTATTGEP
jgi:hypothetical protein